MTNIELFRLALKQLSEKPEDELINWLQAINNHRAHNLLDLFNKLTSYACKTPCQIKAPLPFSCITQEDCGYCVMEWLKNEIELTEEE